MLGASPFESQVILGADTGKHRQLLAPQPRRAPLSAGNQPDIFGTNLVPARTQIIAERVGPPYHDSIVRLSPPIQLSIGGCRWADRRNSQRVSCYRAGTADNARSCSSAAADSVPGSARYMSTWSPPGYGALSRWR